MWREFLTKRDIKTTYLYTSELTVTYIRGCSKHRQVESWLFHTGLGWLRASVASVHLWRPKLGKWCSFWSGDIYRKEINEQHHTQEEERWKILLSCTRQNFKNGASKYVPLRLNHKILFTFVRCSGGEAASCGDVIIFMLWEIILDFFDQGEACGEWSRSWGDGGLREEAVGIPQVWGWHIQWGEVEVGAIQRRSGKNILLKI